MTLENMRYLLKENNKEILDRIQNLEIMIEVLNETGLDYNDADKSYSDDEIETAIVETIDLLNAITEIIELLNNKEVML